MPSYRCCSPVVRRRSPGTAVAALSLSLLTWGGAPGVAQPTASSSSDSLDRKADRRVELRFEHAALVRGPGVVEDVFALPDELSTELRAAEVGETLVLSEFPVELGERQAVRLERVAIYQPGARIVAIDATDEREIAKSDRLFYRGRTLDGATRIGVSMDRETGRLRGSMVGPGGWIELSEQANGDAARHALRRDTEPLDLELSCGSDRLDSRDFDNPIAGSSSLEEIASRMGTSPADGGVETVLKGAAGLREIVVAIDVDDEMMSKRFSDSTSAATSWLAELFNQMNVIYERDLDLTLQQGTTFLRLNDPYTTTESSSSYDQLLEFGSYWQSQHSGVQRAFAMQISGKSSSAWSASGIAWLDGYCESQSYGGGYSVNRVFWNPSVSVASSLRITAHELGHNLGSPHTHCYSPPIDRCYNQEGGGCFSGSTQCPAGGSGTLMSYCHLSSCGAGTGLHPTVVNLLESYVSGHYPSCVTDGGGGGGPGALFSDGFESGSTNAWDQAL